jgi:transcription elongation factor GreA
MRVPKRRYELLRVHDASQDSHYLTPEAVERMKRTLYELEVLQRPKIVEDVAYARSLGDLSENAEYQDAKGRLSRIDGRIFSLKERIKNAVPIEAGTDGGTVRVGSVVTVRVEGKVREYRIVGSQESDPVHGRISHLSPLGKALLAAMPGAVVMVETPQGPKGYEVVDVR